MYEYVKSRQRIRGRFLKSGDEGGFNGASSLLIEIYEGDRVGVEKV